MLTVCILHLSDLEQSSPESSRTPQFLSRSMNFLDFAVEPVPPAPEEDEAFFLSWRAVVLGRTTVVGFFRGFRAIDDFLDLEATDAGGADEDKRVGSMVEGWNSISDAGWWPA